MTIKASILVTSYNKNRELPNVFYSISRQKTDFEFEVCFLDDCSYDDPEPIYQKYLTVKNKKGIRLKQHIGNRANINAFTGTPSSFFKNSYCMTFDMVDNNSDIVVLQSADVVWTSDDILQKFVDSIRPKEVIICDVQNKRVDPCLYENWDKEIDNIVNLPVTEGYYQGEARFEIDPMCAWGPWLMPFYKKDLIEIVKYQEHGNEFGIRVTLEPNGFKPVFRHDIIGIHQQHSNVASVEVTNYHNLVNWGENYPEKVIYQ